MGAVNVAIVLAAGKGSRMKMDMPKQYMLIKKRPLLCYSLDVFQESFIDRIVIVTGAGQTAYVRDEIVKKYGYTKVTSIIEGGRERYDSVYNGLRSVKNADYVYIHDGARPCVSMDILNRGRDEVEKNKAVVCAVRVKDTIKQVKDGIITETPDRNLLWQIQTPQIFGYNIIMDAYNKLYRDPDRKNITDDAMVVEAYGNRKVYVYEGDYNNIKVTTPEDIPAIEHILCGRK